MAAPILYYFDTTGRAEAIRLAFHAAKIEFEDKRFTPEEFAKTYKAISPSGQFPILKVGDQILTESYAILNYAALLGNMMPKDPMHQARIFEIYMAFEALTPTFKKIRMKEATPEECHDEIKKRMSFIDKLVSINQDKEGHTVGNMLTPADFVVFCFTEFAKGMGVTLDSFPHCSKVAEMVTKHPNLQEYFKKSKSA